MNDIIPYSEIKPENDEKIDLKEGEGYEFQDGRRIEVFSHETLSGVWVFISSPMGEGKESLLEFRISDEGAMALSFLLEKKLRSKYDKV